MIYENLKTSIYDSVLTLAVRRVWKYYLKYPDQLDSLLNDRLVSDKYKDSLIILQDVDKMKELKQHLNSFGDLDPESQMKYFDEMVADTYRLLKDGADLAITIIDANIEGNVKLLNTDKVLH